MCAGAILNARIPRVYYGARDREMGACGGVLNLFMEDFPHPPALVGGVLAEDCRRVLADNTPVLFSTDIVPCSLFGTTRTDGIDFTRPIFDILDEACGIQVSSTITHLRAAMGDPAVRHALALQRDQALLELSETCYSRLCRPVLRCRTFYTDFFDFALVRKLV